MTRRNIFTMLASALLLYGEHMTGKRAYSAPVYPGEKSDHFNGETFFNPEDTKPHEFGDFLKWITNRNRGEWPAWTDTIPTVPPKKVNGSEIRLTYINHSTFLIQTRGINILTDPVWSYRASPFSFAGPKRHRAPGVRFEDLPPVDIVLLSHNHYDHMDMPTLKKLHRIHRPRIYTGLGCSYYLKRNGIGGAVEMDWWDSERFNEEILITYLPARHFSQRGMSDRNRTLWGGFAVTTPDGPVYFAGDTGMTKFFAEIRKKIGRPRLALLPIGAYKPRWFMKPAHTSPDEAVEAHKTLQAETSVPMHFGTFPLGDDGFSEGRDRLREIIISGGIHNPEFIIMEPGEGRTLG